jgi:cell division protein ZapA
MSEPMAVQILEREFLVACTPDERPGLAAAASLVDAKMREVRSNARTATIDRIAVMAALNLAHELLELRRTATQVDAALGGELDALKLRLDAMLAAHAR